MTYWRTYEFLKWTRIPHLHRPFLTVLPVAPKTSYFSYAPTWEDTGEHWGPTLVARVPFTRKAVGVGVWLDVDPDDVVTVHTEDAEYDAYVAVNGPVDRGQWRQARQEIAALGLDPSEEMELMQAKGVFE